jgi:hypothetical protein
MSVQIIGRSGSFSEIERDVIAAIAKAVIPEDPANNLPGADDTRILSTVLDKAENFKKRIRSTIEVLVQDTDPLSVAGDELIALLDEDKRFRSCLRLLTTLIMQSYYQDARVLTSHKLVARPPFPQGHDIVSGDWSLLEPVKKRKPFYRSV